MGTIASIEESFEKFFESNKENLVQLESKIDFLNGRYEVQHIIEKKYTTSYCVIDKHTNHYKNLKILSIKNEKDVIEKITKFLNKIKMIDNKNIIKIEDFFIDITSKTVKVIKVYIIEDYIPFISLKDLIGYLISTNEITEKLINHAQIEKLLCNLLKTLMEIVENLNKLNVSKININLCNTYIVKTKENSNFFNNFDIKLCELELAEIFRMNLSAEEISTLKDNYFLTLNNEDLQNIMIMVFQISFTSLNLKKIDFSNENAMKKFRLEILIFNKLNYSQLHMKIKENFEGRVIVYFLDNLLKDLINKSEISKDLLKIMDFYRFSTALNQESFNYHENFIEVYDDLSSKGYFEILVIVVFAILQNSENHKIIEIFQTIDTIKKSNYENLVEYLKANFDNDFSLFINSYIIFLKLLPENDMDFIDLIDSTISVNIDLEESNKIKVFGIFALIFTYINVKGEKMNIVSFMSLMRKVKNNNSLTLVNLIEKTSMNDNFSIIEKVHKYGENFQQAKENLLSILNVVKPKFLRNLKKLYSSEEILSVLGNYPLSLLRKDNIKEIFEILINMNHDTILELEESQVITALKILIYYLIYKKTISSCFIFSTCLSKSIISTLYSSIFTEFSLICKTCTENRNEKTVICLICSHRCHSNHKLAPLGYDYLKCMCLSENCSKNNDNFTLPSYLRYKSAEDSNSFLQDKSEIIKYTNDEGFEEIKKSNTQNVFVSVESETLTLQSKTPICEIELNSTQNQIMPDNSQDETISYFEVEVLMGGYYDQVAIGITNIMPFPKNEFAGYLQDSIGYHGDDGKCYAHSIPYFYGVKFGTGDVIGCGITKRGNVYYVHNKCPLPVLEVKIKGKVFSLISLRGKYCSVSVNHNPPFKFKHFKVENMKNPVGHFNFSKTLAELISDNEKLLKMIHTISMNFNSNQEIKSLFKKYSSMIHKVVKNTKNMSKYLLLFDPITKKNPSDSVGFYQNEENFYNNQKNFGKIYMRPIFESTEIKENDKNENKIKEEKKQSESISKISFPQQSNSSLIKKNAKNCYSGCGSSCLFI